MIRYFFIWLKLKRNKFLSYKSPIFFSCSCYFMLYEFSDLWNHITSRGSASKNFIINSTHGVIRETNTPRSGKWSAYWKRGWNTAALHPAIRTPRSRLGVSYRSAAPANWFFSSLFGERERGEERKSISRECRAHRGAAGTWRKNPSDVTRHPVFQSGIDKKSPSLPFSSPFPLSREPTR